MSLRVLLYGCLKHGLRQWMEKKPASIITDQDLAIGAAIAKVFPETRHRLCLWHIRKKFPEKLAHIYHKKSIFKCDLKNCIQYSPSIQSFEEEWKRLIIEYDLEGNEWLQGLYKIRESWIPIYNKNTFFARMNTTQRSESINAFFYSFVDATTTLQEFVLKFEKAIARRLEDERKEDYESRHKSRILSIGSKLEEHVAFVYTRNIFCKFQDELEKIYKFTKNKIRRDGPRYVYQVSNCFDAPDTCIVDIDLDSKIAKCDCQLYEFMGILCRHILVIFQAKGVTQIPCHYILPRWTKDANKGIEFRYVENNSNGQPNTSKILRRVHAQQEASKLVDLAEETEEIYKFIILELSRAHALAITMKTNLFSGDEVATLLESSQQNVEQIFSLEHGPDAPQLIIGNPHISQTKGRKNDEEKMSQNCIFKSGLEVSLNKSLVKRKACHKRGKHGHNSKTCKKRNQND